MATNNFDWPSCVNSFTPQQGRDLAAERGVDPFTIEQLHSRSWIGSFYVRKWKERCIAFPVCDSNGDVTRWHCRSPQRNGDGKFEWLYHPVGNGQNHSVSALVFGGPNSAKTCYIFESQWDAIVLVDRLKLISEIDAGEVVVIATRGAKIGDRLAGFTLSNGATIYACPQNDAPGKEWLDDVVEATKGCYAFEIPNSYKDLNEWTIAGATAVDVEAAIGHANFQKPQTPTDPDEKLFEDLLAKYRFALLTSEQLETAPIKPRAKLLGEWFWEGDLGFVFGERGIGKTWFVAGLAVHLSTGKDFDSWPVPAAVPVFYLDGEMPEDSTRDRLKGLALGNKKLIVLHHELFNSAGLTMNLADPLIQKAITQLCVDEGIKVLILDNLSCLVSGVKENDAGKDSRTGSWTCGAVGSPSSLSITPAPQGGCAEQPNVRIRPLGSLSFKLLRLLIPWSQAQGLKCLFARSDPLRNRNGSAFGISGLRPMVRSQSAARKSVLRARSSN